MQRFRRITKPAELHEIDLMRHIEMIVDGDMPFPILRQSGLLTLHHECYRTFDATLLIRAKEYASIPLL
jgi:hypothetical protein